MRGTACKMRFGAFVIPGRLRSAPRGVHGSPIPHDLRRGQTRKFILERGLDFVLNTFLGDAAEKAYRCRGMLKKREQMKAQRKADLP